MPLIEALRPHQWVKNLLVFAPLVFARKLIDPAACLHAASAFVAFCAVASGIYLLNDLSDIDADKLHPEKKLRPLPSGRLSAGTAKVTLVLLWIGGLALAFLGANWFHWPLGVYLVINIFYSLKLKQVVLLDTMCIALGFLLRIYSGAVAIGEEASPWLVLCTFFVALLLAFGKRRHELHLLGEGSLEHRKSLAEYSLPYLDQLIAPLGALTVMTYAMYTVSERTITEVTDKLIFTVPFVVYGIFRYLYLVHMRAEGGNPTRLLLKDPPMFINIVLWLGVSVWAVYTGAAVPQ